MKKYAITIVVIFCSFIYVSMALAEGWVGTPSVIVNTKIIDPRQILDFKFDYIAETLGNNTYLPLNIQGTPGKNYYHIFQALRAFEKYRGVEIISFRVESYNVYSAGSGVEGIWVVHTQPK